MNKKVVVITGASSGIGAAIALKLAKSNYRIILGARRADKLESITKEINSNGGEADYSVADVTDVDQVKALVDKAISRFGQIDVLINCAGIMLHSNLSDARINDWNKMIDINIKGTLYGIAAAQPYFHKQNSGYFINIGSVASLYAHAGGAVYSATKWAVKAITESLREEEALAKKNVRVTGIYPGAVRSELVTHETVSEQKDKATAFYETTAIPAERIAQAVLNALEMPTDTTLDEIVIRPTKQVG